MIPIPETDSTLVESDNQTRRSNRQVDLHQNRSVQTILLFTHYPELEPSATPCSHVTLIIL